MKTLTPATSRIRTLTLSLGRSSLQDGLWPLATRLGRRLALPLLFVGAALLVQPCAAAPFQWEFTGNLHTPRYYHTATMLSDGRLLVIGGATTGPQTFPDPGTPSVEAYDPATGTWTVNGSLIGQRLLHTATLLSNGTLVIAGGWPDPYSTYTWEVYDPATGTWTVTGSLNTARQGHTATLLANGTVLVAGGMNTGTITSAEIYDPATGNWTPTGSLNVARWRHAAALFSDGRVLVAGGLAGNQSSLADAEIYDPATGNWTVTGSLNNARCLYTATLLPDGRVLVAGGKNNDGILATAETFDPGVTPTPTPTATATPTPTATPASIELTGRGRRIGGINTSHLKWRGATSANDDAYRHETL